jgi:hypothetical protein
MWSVISLNARQQFRVFHEDSKDLFGRGGRGGYSARKRENGLVKKEANKLWVKLDDGPQRRTLSFSIHDELCHAQSQVIKLRLHLPAQFFSGRRIEAAHAQAEPLKMKLEHLFLIG